MKVLFYSVQFYEYLLELALLVTTRCIGISMIATDTNTNTDDNIDCG